MAEDYKGSITLASVVDGADASGRLIIETSDEMIYKFYTSQDNKQYSPDEIAFWVREIGTGALMVPGTDYDDELELIGTSVNDYKYLWHFFSRLYGNTGSEGTGVQSGTVLSLVRSVSNNQIIFKIGILSSLILEIGENKTSAEDAVLFETFRSNLYNNNYYFNFKVYNHSNNNPPAISDLLLQKPIGVEFGTSDEMAKFGLTAASINMLVRSTKLTFDTQGLHLENGAFDIAAGNYVEANPSQSEFNANKSNYYIYDDSSANYIQCTDSTVFSSSTQYYTYEVKKLLEYNADLQTLNVEGSGKFSGTIEAESGYFKGELQGASGDFTGTITANSGEIGGWRIVNSGLISTAQDSSGNSLIELLGTTGLINAQYINLGTGAHINEYIQLGEDTYLYNADTSPDNVVLSVPGIQLKRNGILQLGSISLNGIESELKGANWSIAPSIAKFSNVNISGKIQSAVFETDSTATVGGIMLFKPSYKVEQVSQTSNQGSWTTSVVLDAEYTGTRGDWFSFVTESGKLLDGCYKIDSINNNIITVSSPSKITALDGVNIMSIIVLGQIDAVSYIEVEDLTEQQYLANPVLYYIYNSSTGTYIQCGVDDSYNENITYYIFDPAKTEIVIGVNSTSSSNQFLLERGLTVAELYTDSSIPSYTTTFNMVPKVFLGDLNALNIDNVKGYGLYGQNVYLTGSLTTQVQSVNNTSYAGVNTLNGAIANKFDEDDTSKIVFWAGSAGISNESIAAAPFQVTEEGSLYASRGIFEGSIITRSTIEGSLIRTSRIEGIGTNPALKILDALNGIGFYQQVSGNEQEVFTIGNQGLKTNDTYFISINPSNLKVSANMENIYANIYSTRNENGTILYLSKNMIQGVYNDDVSSTLSFSPTGIQVVVNNSNIFNMTDALIALNTDTINIKKDVIYGNNVMKYQVTHHGYDLYVSAN